MEKTSSTQYPGSFICAKFELGNSLPLNICVPIHTPCIVFLCSWDSIPLLSRGQLNWLCFQFRLKHHQRVPNRKPLRLPCCRVNVAELQETSSFPLPCVSSKGQQRPLVQSQVESDDITAALFSAISTFSLFFVFFHFLLFSSLRKLITSQLLKLLYPLRIKCLNM